MEDVIQVQDQFYILATSPLADDRTRVLKHGETFAVFDRFGDIQAAGLGQQGIFHEGTRYLSRAVLRINDRLPMLLSSSVNEDNATLAVDLTNPDVSRDGELIIPRGTVHCLRSKFLWNGSCYEVLRFRNFGLNTIEVAASIAFDADFADIFEVRGLHRERRGRRLEERVVDGTIVLSYMGLDQVVRHTCISIAPRPKEVTGSGVRLLFALGAGEEVEYQLAVHCEAEDGRAARIPYQAALLTSSEELKSLRSADCRIYTANEQFNHWLNRSAADLHMMLTSTPQMVYPYAGVPWFSTVFGRDGIITSLEYLWVNPAIARGVLAYLALTQADDLIPESDAEPGKILHEQRAGEMAVLGEHPFLRYYGTIDATPLFVLLAGAYYERTADLEFIRSLWPNIERALEWIDAYGDRDRDGFVEYARVSEHGLVQQGWKDSQDSVSHSDGRLAEAPIALCEVQAYVYGARRSAARLAVALGLPGRAAQLELAAGDLRDRFEQAFWDDELGMYVLALDGDKRPCRVRSSNAGQVLFTGIAGADRARATAQALLGPEMFSGWGIRTLGTVESRYNPMSYHNGSVWPHDNALVAAGFSRYGRQEDAARVMTGLFDAALFLDQQRLPELFCGFARRAGQGPTQYPVACSPQAWASASAFLLLQACLGLSVDALERKVVLRYPYLPEFLPELEIRNLRVGDASVDLRLDRHPFSVGVNVMRREGQVEIVAIK